MKKKWQDKEKSDAKQLNARQTPRSGGLWFAKGDMKDGTFLYDSKDTKHSRFSVTAKIWKKINKEGLLASRLPALLVEMVDDKDKDKKIKLVVLDVNDFLWMKKKLEE